MEQESVLHHQQIPSAYGLQPRAVQAIQHGQHAVGHHTLASSSGLDLGLEAEYQSDLRLQDHNGYQASGPYERNIGMRNLPVGSNGSPHTPQQHNGGQFGILTSGPPMHHESIARLQQEDDIFGGQDDQKSVGHLSTKIVVDPPDLAEWRQKLFNVDEMITLSEDEYVLLLWKRLLHLLK